MKSTKNNQPNSNPVSSNHFQAESSGHTAAPCPGLCFSNTDVPMACLFIHIDQGYSLTQFLQDFPSVSEEEVRELLEWTIAVFKSPNLIAEVIIDQCDREEEMEDLYFSKT
ncbi:MAG: DUF433 domain-containing protein [Lewinella sp.]|nr:DUF433 domain-containing protein [Lewinella sp.]